MGLDQQPQDKNHPPLQKAKRLFFVNLILFVFLILANVLIFSSNAKNTDEDSHDVDETSTKPVLSHQESAYLKGQILGLSEHPDTMPEYGAKWVMNVSRQEMMRDPEFSALSATDIHELVEKFFEGYTENFNAYYDSHSARKFGYDFGLKFDPTVHKSFAPETENILLRNRTQIEEVFNIQSEAEWSLFCRAFDKGFVQGYFVVEKGITSESFFDKLELF